MKRIVLPGVALMLVLALVFWGQRILEKTLDAELPKLLTSELGIPVTLAPVRASITRLTVHTPKLVMGNVQNPALLATNVSISLEWSDLLAREIRLRRAAGTSVTVNPSLWPANDNPWPSDYSFLEPFLPQYLALEQLHYVDNGRSYSISRPQWQRNALGATIAGQYQLQGQPLAIKLTLQSLDELLKLTGLNLGATTTAPGEDKAKTAITVDIKPGVTSGYLLAATFSTGEISAELKAGSAEAWQLPTESTTRIKKLEVEQLQALIDSYTPDNSGAPAADALAQALPPLSLPPHKGLITIGELRWKNESALATTLEISTDHDGIKIPLVTSKLSGGVLQGEAEVHSEAKGWQLTSSAHITAGESGTMRPASILDATWAWRKGSARAKGQGTTWGELLDSLEGDFTLEGAHLGAVETPITASATLDTADNAFALEAFEVTVGDGRISGALSLSGSERRVLAGQARLEQLNLDFLQTAAAPAASRGIEIPNYLNAFPELDLDLKLDIDGLSSDSLSLTRGTLALNRKPEHAFASAHVLGASGGLFDLTIEVDMPSASPANAELHAEFSHFNIPDLFQPGMGVIDTRTSGTVHVTGQGQDVQQVIAAMTGKAELSVEIRQDHNWQREPVAAEQLQLSGEAVLVLEDDVIAGLELRSMVMDSVLQNVSGSLSMVDGRKPWLVVDLRSDKLDLDDLLKYLAQEPEAGPESNSLDALKKLGDSRFSLRAAAVKFEQRSFTDAALQISTTADYIEIEHLDFSLGNAELRSSGSMSWKEGVTTLSANADIAKLDPGVFFSTTAIAASAPLSGTLSLDTSGTTVAEMLTGLSGEIKLAAAPKHAGVASDPIDQIEVTASRIKDGIRADIHRFKWSDTDLAGSLQYHQTSPPLVEITLDGGSLSLLPWETAAASSAANADKPAGSVIGRTAKASVKLIGDVISAPFRLISGPREAEPGEKLFSATPLPFEWLRQYQLRVSGTLDQLVSSDATAKNLSVSASLIAGKLDLKAGAGSVNGGSASINLQLDSAELPSVVKLSGSFQGLRGQNAKSSFPRSGYFDVNSRGQSQAELAANINGLVYLELGAGQLDYSNLMLLTADVATSVFQTLIPGVDKIPPQLECAVTLAMFEDGMGTTPYGYAARTNQANLVGRVDINMKKELLHMNFSSSSRKGVGFSLGNVFSNTVEIEGPFTNPRIIPNTGGLLWRSWAAVMTGGLSVVGESVLKRALASDNPCTSVQQHIHKKFCAGSESAGVSPMVCPRA